MLKLVKISDTYLNVSEAVGQRLPHNIVFVINSVFESLI